MDKNIWIKYILNILILNRNKNITSNNIDLELSKEKLKIDIKNIFITWYWWFSKKGWQRKSYPKNTKKNNKNSNKSKNGLSNFDNSMKDDISS